MRNTALAVVSAAVLCGAGGFVAWAVLSRTEDPALASEAAKSFNLQTGPAPVAQPLASLQSEDLRDAPVSAPVPLPIPTEGMAGVPGAASAPAPAPERKPVVKAVVTPSRERWARRNRIFAALLRAPASVMSAGSALRSPRGLRAFLEDKRRVEGYMNSPLVRIVLNSPTLAKAILGSPALARAFLSSPAMSDPGAASALLSSRMTRKMLDCPGVQAALADPKIVAALAGDPKVARWLGENPRALGELAGAAPSLAGALSLGR